MNLGISGFPPDTTEEEVHEALEKFGAVIQGVIITPSTDPDRYLATVTIDTNRTGIKVLAKKIDGTTWKGKRLSAADFLY